MPGRRATAAAAVAAAAALSFPLGAAEALPTAPATVPTVSGYVTNQTSIAPYTTSDTSPGDAVPLDANVTDLGTVIGGGLIGLHYVDDTHYTAVTVDPTAGTTATIATLPAADNHFWPGIAGMANGATYAARSTFLGAPDTGLYKVVGSDATPVGSDSSLASLRDFTGGCGSTLFGVDYSDQVDAIDAKTGVLTPGATVQFGANEFIKGLAYDHATRTLWMLTIQDNNDLHLSVLNPKTGAVTPSPFAGTVSTFWQTIAFDGPEECRYKRTLSLQYGAKADVFHGRLNSAWAPCVKAMTVKLLRRRPGPDRAVGSDVTDGSGAYQIPGVSRHGTYYATTSKRTTTSGICLAARSGNLAH